MARHPGGRILARRYAGTVAFIATTALLAGCAIEAEPPTPLPPAPSESGVAAPGDDGPVQPVGEATPIVAGLDAPWSVAFLEDGSAFVSERDTALVKEISTREVGATREVRDVGEVPGVAPAGEGGLLGLATLVDGDDTWLYAYLTSPDDNRIVRMPLTGAPGSRGLGAPEIVLDGLAKAGNHNGGRIKFGPDGMLYATVGDANETSRSQDPGSLNGKILRMTPSGGTPDDNPFDGSLVYSLGHRNPQGLAWDADGQLWAAEFGQNTWDEFNRIEAGSNYGWPIVEGIADNPEFVNPEYQWSPSEASPSGLAFVRGTFFLAALRGERAWALYADDAVEAVPYFQGQFGRVRDVVPAPDGSLWMLTSNSDRGGPGGGDDQIIEVQLAPRDAG